MRFFKWLENKNLFLIYIAANYDTEKKIMFRLDSRVTWKVNSLTPAVLYFNQVSLFPLFLSQSYARGSWVLSGHFALLLTEWRSQGPALLPGVWVTP